MRLGFTLRRLAAIALLGYAAWLPAQSFDLDHDREPVVSLDGNWRFHPGDSPENSAGALLWAAPSFDDSAWPLLRGDSSWADQGYPEMSGFAWYRFTVKVAAGDGPTSLMFGPILTSYEVYVDGTLAGGSGKMPPTRTPNTSFSYHVFPLTTSASAAPRTVQVALRVWHSPIWAGYMGGGPFFAGNLAGDAKLLAAEHHHQQLARNVHFVDYYSYSIAAALTGFAILWLFICRPSEREYLWFAVMLLSQALDSVLNVSKEIYAFPPIPVFDLLDGVLAAIIVVASFCFFARVLRARAGLLGRIFLALVAISPLPAVAYWPGWCSVPTGAAIQLACLLPAALWIFWLLGKRALSGNLDALLLLAPTLLDLGFYVADNVAIVIAQEGWTSAARVLEVPLPLPPFTMHLGILLHLFFLLAMLVFLIRRFTLARQQEERLEGELEAARQVQQVLLPDELDQCDGFTVECIYCPADEVGGDFFQQIGDGRGGMSIVVGDVSGKGLPAAMLVGVLVGAIRSETAHGADPAVLLNSLNQRMMGRSRGGFTTCLAAHISADGLLTLANAGHLPPYLNGEEIGVSGALPLGIVARVQYECTTVRLAPGDRLTFVSDGVVEAQSKTGELFGFERTREISTSPASRIADAARAFGQTDDITVVTVELAGSTVELAAAQV
jgi:hypothetical protein